MVCEAFYTIGEMHPEVISFIFMTFPPWICHNRKSVFHLDLVLRNLVCHKFFLVSFFRPFPPTPNLFTFIQTDQRHTEVGAAVFITNLQYLSHCLIRPQFLPPNCMLFSFR